MNGPPDDQETIPAQAYRSGHTDAAERRERVSKRLQRLVRLFCLAVGVFVLSVFLMWAWVSSTRYHKLGQRDLDRLFRDYNLADIPATLRHAGGYRTGMFDPIDPDYFVFDVRPDDVHRLKEGIREHFRGSPGRGIVDDGPDSRPRYSESVPDWWDPDSLPDSDFFATGDLEPDGTLAWEDDWWIVSPKTGRIYVYRPPH